MKLNKFKFNKSSKEAQAAKNVIVGDGKPKKPTDKAKDVKPAKAPAATTDSKKSVSQPTKPTKTNNDNSSPNLPKKVSGDLATGGGVLGQFNKKKFVTILAGTMGVVVLLFGLGLIGSKLYESNNPTSSEDLSKEVAALQESDACAEIKQKVGGYVTKNVSQDKDAVNIVSIAHSCAIREGDYNSSIKYAEILIDIDSDNNDKWVVEIEYAKANADDVEIDEENENKETTEGEDVDEGPFL